MWLRDAVLENKLPTIEQMTVDPRIFPYRFGHALWSYIGERWGDEAVGAILQGTLAGGIEGSIRRTLGLSVEQLSQQWRDAVFREYLPEVGERGAGAADRARCRSTRRARRARLHIAPAISPDGSLIAYFSERDGFSVDMFLADAATGQVKRRLLKPTWSSNYETFRFLNSQARLVARRQVSSPSRAGAASTTTSSSWRPSGTRRSRRITVKLDGVTTPSLEPRRQATRVHRLRGRLLRPLHRQRRRHGPQAPHQRPLRRPAPGLVARRASTIAFTTDRGPGHRLRGARASGNLPHRAVRPGQRRVPRARSHGPGKNINPVWSPDGKSLAFVSDRGGVSDLYLYDFGRNEVYQLTHLLTGSRGLHAAVAGADLGRRRPTASPSCTTRRAPTTSTCSTTRGS